MTKKFIEIYHYDDNPRNYPDGDAIIARAVASRGWPHDGWLWEDLLLNGKHKVGIWPKARGKTIRMIDVFTPDDEVQWYLDRYFDGLDDVYGEWEPDTAAQAAIDREEIEPGQQYRDYVWMMEWEAEAIGATYDEWYSPIDGQPVQVKEDA